MWASSISHARQILALGKDQTVEETGFDDVAVVFQHSVSVVLLVLLDIKEESPVSPRLVLEVQFTYHTVHPSREYWLTVLGILYYQSCLNSGKIYRRHTICHFNPFSMYSSVALDCI